MKESDITDDECGQPCDPKDDCEECCEYWDRMRREGFWVDGEGWTNKAVREWSKVI